MKRFLFELYLLILITIVTTCAFGGGCLYYVAFCLICGFSKISPIVCVITCLAPVPLCWWLVPKISDKYF